MKKSNLKRILSISLFVVMLVSLLVTAAFPVSAASAKFVGIDKTTQGNWEGKYGSEGYVIPVAGFPFDNLPDYATLDVLNFVGNSAPRHTWLNEETGEGNAPLLLDAEYEVNEHDYNGVPLMQPGSIFCIASCWYDNNVLTAKLYVGDTAKKVTLYLADIDSRDENIRKMEVAIFDTNNNVIVPAITVSEFFAGEYYSFEISGDVNIKVTNVAGIGNAAIGGIFFDPAEGGEEIKIDPPSNNENKPPVDNKPAEKTGDSIYLFITLAVVSLAGAVVFVSRKRVSSK